MVESRYNLKRKLSMPKSNISNENNESHGPTKAEVDALEWLKFNKTPEPTVYKKWSETYYLRRRDITEHTSKLYENWPLFKQNIGACLVITFHLFIKPFVFNVKISCYRLNWISINSTRKKIFLV